MQHFFSYLVTQFGLATIGRNERSFSSSDLIYFPGETYTVSLLTVLL